MRGNARSIRVALLTDELMRLKSWGCGRPKALQLLAQMQVLRDLARVPKSLDLSPNAAGKVIRDNIEEAIRSFPEGNYVFDRSGYPAATMREAFRIELGLGFKGGDRLGRHCRLMLLLARWDSERVWRDDYEREFLTILAEHMVPTEYDQAA